MHSIQNHPASYRDPDGFLFYRDNGLYRQINTSYQPHYERLMDSGLYRTLTEAGLLVRHQEVTIPAPDPAGAWKVIAPEPLSFISYPYGWSFSALKKAALLTLDIQKSALDAGMWLKDASAYNIQFRGIRPVFIDTLSFTSYTDNTPWPAYRQFCEHFLAPLALMSKRDPRLLSLLALHADGIPLDLACKLLPCRSLLSPHLVMHLFLHARLQKSASRRTPGKAGALPRHQLMGILESLRAGVEKLCYQPGKGDWAGYYVSHSYTAAAFAHKQEVVAGFLAQCGRGTVLDVGANTGHFSRLAARSADSVVAIDADPTCSEINFRRCEEENIANVLPLTVDILNPTPATGFGNTEHASFTERMSCDTLSALALLHHLRIRGNLPFARFAEFAASIGKMVIAEFTPRTDPEAARMLEGRGDAFPDYSTEGFEAAFAARFERKARVPLKESERVLYLYARKS